jgi:predicted RecB family nuclease
VTTRHDVSAVPLQGGYVAKLCPVRAQNDIIRPVQPMSPSAVLERRFVRGRDFEAEILIELLGLHRDAVVIEGNVASEVEVATSQALADGVHLIAGGRLPADPIGRRVGKPDLLAFSETGGYRAIDVKHHMSLAPAEDDLRGMGALWSELADPWFETAQVDDGFTARKRKEDLLQLAHYQRMLEAVSLAAGDGRFGGIIGVERRVIWYDLDAPIWRTPSSSGRQKLRSTMEIYDFEFEFRLDIMAVAQQHQADPGVELLVVPVRIGECPECPWWDYCRQKLEAGSGDVSLLPRIGWREWKIHRERGTRDRATLAALDHRTAELVAAGVNVVDLIARTKNLPARALIAEIPEFRRRRAQLAALKRAGIRTAADSSRLSEATAAYCGTGLSSLPEQIDQARAALGPEPVYRRRNLDRVTVPRADIEVDVDMENVEDGVYLWGALLTDRTTEPVSAYHHFVTWEPLTLEEQARNFVRFWTWFWVARSEALKVGRSFRAYCYNASAENMYLRSLGAAAGVLDDVEGLTRSDEWVDMLRVFDSQLITGGPSGLKVVAQIAGNSWPVDDPGGAESMLRYETAVSDPSQSARRDARTWLLSYNRGDVEATLALRDWLGSGVDIPPIESLGA